MVQTKPKYPVFHDPRSGLFLDLNDLGLGEGALIDFEAGFAGLHTAMEDLEAGAVANPDENRMVGHYWLRNPSLAPAEAIKAEIESTLEDIGNFAADVHSGTIRSGDQQTFTDLLIIGIGGSALGPQFVADAVAPRDPALQIHFLDNSDPDGMDRVLHRLGHRLHRTLVVVISKSGGTPETRNGMLEAQARFSAADINFSQHAVAITGTGSKLYQQADTEGWLKIFPMWDWVGGRTSETSAVGLLPAILQGINIDELLKGAREMDELTRRSDIHQNPAAQLCLAWYHATEGRGSKDMVVLPYKDSLILFSRYLQQLIMESLGKELDLDGSTVEQGITVYGNKGSTDQHAYVQQLRDGIHNFFVTFIEVLKDRQGGSISVDGTNTSGDYLYGFLEGTRKALRDKGRASVTISIPEVTPYTTGALIALFERAVGYYASLVNINAYHQPGVEAGKQAAAATLNILNEVLDLVDKQPGQSIAEIAQTLSADPDLVYRILRRAEANGKVASHGTWSQPDSLRFSPPNS